MLPGTGGEPELTLMPVFQAQLCAVLVRPTGSESSRYWLGRKRSPPAGLRGSPWPQVAPNTPLALYQDWGWRSQP